MATLQVCFLFCIVLLLPFSTRSTPPICDTRHCGSFGQELAIEFPFYLKEGYKESSDRCGYPGFEVSCNDKNKQALLTFQHGGEFVVTVISIEQQRVWIKDPGDCLPRRYLQNNINLTVTDSPFQLDKSGNFDKLIFLNCSKSEVDESFLDPFQRIPCLSNDEYAIIYTSLTVPLQPNLLTCHEIGSALIPIEDDHSQQPRLVWEALHSDIILQWDKPLCGLCEADQRCGFSTDTGLDVTCYDDGNVPSGQGGRRPSTFGIVRYLPVAWGISVLLFLFCITISFVLRGTLHGLQRETNRESNIQQPPMAMAVDGIDLSTIEKFPKIQVGERGQLPKPIDNVCSICLSEYEPMETLRSMPRCNHYFHAQCIDAWLKMNATCPLCRNLPEGSV